MSYNLSSLTLRAPMPADPGALADWFEGEIPVDDPLRAGIPLRALLTSIPAYVRFPATARLLVPGCYRRDGSHFHTYPDALKKEARENKIQPDRRANGPAIMAFRLAGGKRPKRLGNSNGWSIHHLYSGKFPYFGRTTTLHAVKDGDHFSNSAGLVAAHPLLDALCDEYPAISWILRRKAFELFAYDPDRVFTAA